MSVNANANESVNNVSENVSDWNGNVSGIELSKRSKTDVKQLKNNTPETAKTSKTSKTSNVISTLIYSCGKRIEIVRT